MKDRLAKEILARTMKWDALTLEKELSILQMMSDLKYDGYQQFINGKQFIESLALWLERFEEKDRQLVYTFVKEQIIYVSEQEMHETAIGIFIWQKRDISILSTKNFVFRTERRSSYGLFPQA